MSGAVISSSLTEPSRTSWVMPAAGERLHHTVVASVGVPRRSYADVFRALATSGGRTVEEIIPGSGRGRYVAAIREFEVVRAVVVRHRSHGPHRLVLTEESDVPPLCGDTFGDPGFESILPTLSPLEQLYSGRDLERATEWRQMVASRSHAKARFDALAVGTLISLTSWPGRIFQLTNQGTLILAGEGTAPVQLRGWHLSHSWQVHPSNPVPTSALEELLSGVLSEDRRCP